MATNNISIQARKSVFQLTTFISKANLFWKIKVFLFLFSIYLIFEGLFGIQIGIINPAITLIWIGWWLVIVFIYLPFNAKNWCSICPIPLIGQTYNKYAPLNWLQAKKINKKITLFGLLPILLFLIFSAISVPVSTIPYVTGIILLALFILSGATDIYYGERTFCKEICPINPLLQTYNNMRSVSLKTVDFSICTTKHEKTCMIGDVNSNGCDWGFFPGKLHSNANNCTNCCDCVSSCSYANLTLNTKKPNIIPDKKEKITWIRFFSPIFFLGIALMYSVTKVATVEPFHKLILINNILDMFFSIIMELFMTLIVIPSIFGLLVLVPIYIFMNDYETRMKTIKRSSFATIPISLAIWLIFTIYLIIPNFDILFFTLADPISLHWNILNLKSVTLYSGSIKLIFNYVSQMILSFGYVYSLYYSYKLIDQEDLRLKNKFVMIISQFIFYSLIFLLTSLLYL